MNDPTPKDIIDELVNRVFRAADLVRNRSLAKGAEGLDWSEEEDEKALQTWQAAISQFDGYMYYRELPDGLVDELRDKLNH